MAITPSPAYQDGLKDKEYGFHADPARRGWYTPINRSWYYEGYGSTENLLVQGWLFEEAGVASKCTPA